jgi:PHD/YefM family antitoxin component YafN of YafNO toxin-antitoxin module
LFGENTTSAKQALQPVIASVEVTDEQIAVRSGKSSAIER